MKFITLFLPIILFASCSKRVKPEPDGPSGPTMLAESAPAKKRAPRKSCRELYELLYEMDDFHQASRAMCIRNSLDRCAEQGLDQDCQISKVTLCQQKYLAQQLNYMQRFRKRKCWSEILTQTPQATEPQ